MKIGRSALLTGAVLLAIDVALSTQAPPQSATFNADVEGYIASFYDQLPAAGVRYVFYEDETIRGSIKLLNGDELNPLTVTVPRDRPVGYMWLETPGQAPTLQIETALYLDDHGTRSPAEFEREVHVPPLNQVVVPFEFGTSDLPAGVYRVRFRPRAWESERRILADYDVLSFELRERREVVSVVEALYREVIRALSSLDMQSAENAVNRMLEVYPESALAHSLRGHIARRAGRINDAVASETRARDLINGGRDRLYLARPKRGLD